MSDLLPRKTATHLNDRPAARPMRGPVGSTQGELLEAGAALAGDRRGRVRSGPGAAWATEPLQPSPLASRAEAPVVEAASDPVEHAALGTATVSSEWTSTALAPTSHLEAPSAAASWPAAPASSASLTASSQFSYATATMAAQWARAVYAANAADVAAGLEAMGWAPLVSAHPGYAPLNQGVLSIGNAVAFAGVRQSGNVASYVISFRGSDDAPDWYRNNLRSYGFSEYYVTLRPLVEETLWQALQDIDAGRKVELTITGHSLGGAAVQAALLDILLPHDRGVWTDPGIFPLPLRQGDRLGESAAATAAYGLANRFGSVQWNTLLESTSAYVFGAPQLAKDIELAGQSLQVAGWLAGLGATVNAFLDSRLFQFEHGDSSWLGIGDPVPLAGVLPLPGVSPLGTIADIDLSPSVSAQYQVKDGVLPLPVKMHDMQLYRESVLRAITGAELIKPELAGHSDSPLLQTIAGFTGTSANDFIHAGAITQGLAGNDVILVGSGGTFVVDSGSGSDMVVVSARNVQLSLTGDTTQDVLWFHNQPYAMAVDFAFDQPSITLSSQALGTAGFAYTLTDAFSGGNGYALAGIGWSGSSFYEPWTTTWQSPADLGLPYFVHGNGSADTLAGTDAADLLVGRDGNDVLSGLAGDDVLYGGEGADNLRGGSGADIFAIAELPGSAGPDVVLDYHLGEGDLVDVSRLIGAAFAAGQGAEALVRALPGGSGALLQVDVDGTSGPAQWETVAEMPGVREGTSIAVAIDSRRGMADYNLPVGNPLTRWSIASDNVSVREGSGSFSFTFSRADASSAQTIYFSTLFYPGTADSSDLEPVTNRAVAFSVGQITSDPITVAVRDDAVIEFAEAFGVVLQSAPGLAVEQRLGSMLVVIEDDENVPVNTSGGTGDDWVRIVPPATGGVGADMGAGIDRAIMDFSLFDRPMATGEDWAANRYRVTEGTEFNAAFTRGVVIDAEDVMVLAGSGGSNVFGRVGNDVLIGGSGVDQLNGYLGHNVLLGGAGNDVFYGSGSSGRDVADGGSGDDGFYLTTPGTPDTLFGGSGQDWANIFLQTETAPMRLYADLSPHQSIPLVLPDGTTLTGFERLQILGGLADDQLWLVGGPGTGRSVWSAGTGFDSLVVDLRHFTAAVESASSSSGASVQELPWGDTEFSIGAYGIESLTVFAGSGDDVLRGTPNSDFLAGYSGNDRFFGSPGFDTLMGGEGADVLDDQGHPTFFDGGPGLDYATLDRSTATNALDVELDVTAAGDRAFNLTDGTVVRDIEGLNFRSGSGDDRLTLVADPSLTRHIPSHQVLRWQAGLGRDELVMDLRASETPLWYWDSGVLSTYIDSGVTVGYYYVTFPSTDSIEKMTVFAGGGDDSFSLTDSATEYALDGGPGDDSFLGGFASNEFTGGPGSDVFAFALGTSSSQVAVDTITDLAPEDRIVIGGRTGLWRNPPRAGDGSFVTNGDVEVSFADGHTHLWFDTNNTPGAEVHIRLVGRFEPSQFMGVNQPYYTISTDLVLLANRPPSLATPQPDRTAEAGTAFTLRVEPGSFTDPDGTGLVVTATRSDGTVLPNWLRFDAGSGTLTGVPTAADVGVLSLRLRATDRDGRSADDVFELVVAPAGFDALAYLASHADLRQAYGLDTHAATRHYVTTGQPAGRRIDFDAMRYLAGYDDLIRAYGSNADAATTHFIVTGAAEGRNPWFDARAYWSMNAEARRQAGYDATALARHFVVQGFAAGASRQIDGLRYIASYGDLIRAFGLNAAAGANHFAVTGFGEGRKVTFDPLAYIASYGDLIRAFGTNADAGLRHFIGTGYGESRSVSFDPLRYIASHDDLVRAFGADTRAGTSHYIATGLGEGRRVDFDARQYAAMSPAARAEAGSDPAALARHYIQVGNAAGATWRLDALAYIASYGDLIRAYGLNGAAGLQHFVLTGHGEGRTVSFDALRYVASHGDLITAFGLDTGAATRHYIATGFGEGRGLRDFDVWQYLQASNDLRAAFGTNLVAATRHYIGTGFAEGRATRLPSVVGTSQEEVLRGTTGAEMLFGGAGDDRLEGGSGNDILVGGAGRDVLIGGDGKDIFRFELASHGGDSIADFTSGTDIVLLDRLGFPGFAPGTLDPLRLAANSQALGARAGFVFDTATGALSFDPDGSGWMAATPLLSIGPGRTLRPTDVVIGS